MHRLDAHHITSVFAAFNCRWLLLIHADMSLIQAETTFWKLAEPSVWQQPYTCRLRTDGLKVMCVHQSGEVSNHCSLAKQKHHLIYSIKTTKTWLQCIKSTKKWQQQNFKHTLEEFWSGIRRTPTKCVEFVAKRELITKPKIGNFYVQVCIKQQIFSLHKQQLISINTITLVLAILKYTVITRQHHYGISFSWPICWCCLDHGPGSFDVEDATTLS